MIISVTVNTVICPGVPYFGSVFWLTMTKYSWRQVLQRGRHPDFFLRGFPGKHVLTTHRLFLEHNSSKRSPFPLISPTPNLPIHSGQLWWSAPILAFISPERMMCPYQSLIASSSKSYFYHQRVRPMLVHMRSQLLCSLVYSVTSSLICDRLGYMVFACYSSSHLTLHSHCHRCGASQGLFQTWSWASFMVPASARHVSCRAAISILLRESSLSECSVFVVLCKIHCSYFLFSDMNLGGSIRASPQIACYWTAVPHWPGATWFMRFHSKKGSLARALSL